MFGQSTGFGQFGQPQPQANAFGAAPAANPFGGSTFGQQAPAFGATAAGGMFGQQASAPAFGAPSASFGSTSFGAPKPAFGAFGSTSFGASSQPGFGAPAASTAFGSQPAFGASTQAPAFGATPAFGASPTPTFGAASAAPTFGAAPAFGAASAPAFGAAANPFGGGSTFGAAAPAFGAASPAAAPAFGASSSPGFGGAFGATAAPAFGAAQPASPGGLFGSGAFGVQPAASGTRGVAYQKTSERETSAQGASTVSNFITITAMPAYQGKSQEELRWEDYQQGVKSASSGSPQQTASTGLFGSPAASAPAGFGAAASPPLFGAAAPAFGATSTFGANTFGSPASAPAFGATSFTSGAFGAPSTAGAFGATTNLFGNTAPASQPASIFNAAPSFSSSAATFGTSNAFGAAPAAASNPFNFNSSASSSIFGSSPSLFGNTGAAATTNAFGTTSFTSAPAFGSAASTGLFGSAPAFGASFAAKPGAFSFNSSPATNTGFGGSLSFVPTSSSPGLFSTAPAASTTGGAFSFSLSPGGQFGTPGQAFTMPGALGTAAGSNALVLAQQGPPPSVGQTPYGTFPSLPVVSEPKVGISARPLKNAIGGTSIRGSPLLSLRSTVATPKFGYQPRGSSASPLALITASPSNAQTSSTADVTTSSKSALHGPGSNTFTSDSAGSTHSSILPLRSNPHRLFIREPPPATEAGINLPSTSPVLTPIRPLQAAGNHMTPPEAEASPGAMSNGHGANGANGSPSPYPSASASKLLDILPRLGPLAADGYSYEPSATQLEAMYRIDPTSIKQVMNFTISRSGVGQVRWLKPVDVTSLSLDRIIVIQQGEVCCYTDESKPPVGQGLNTDAEITLYNIYKLDRETKQPVRDGPSMLKWEKTLRTMCAKMGAKFVYYKLDGGVWKFEVEHFSRYGLLDLDEDEEDSAVEQARVVPTVAAKKLPPGSRSFGLNSSEFDDEGDDHMVDEREAPEVHLSAGRVTTVSNDGLLQDRRASNYTAADKSSDLPAAGRIPVPPLQHSLPSQLNVDPSRMLAMHDSLFSGGQDNGSMNTQLHQQAPTSAEVLPGSINLEWDMTGRSTGAGHLWHRKPGPLTSTPQGVRLLLEQEPSSAAPSPLVGTARRVSSSPARKNSLHGPYPALQTSACYTDAGLALGPTFRVGWGPGGTLVIPGNTPGCHLVSIQKLNIEGAAQTASRLMDRAGDVRSLKDRLSSMLVVHLQYSTPDASTTLAVNSGQEPEAGSSADMEEDASHAAHVPAIPLWSLKCDSVELEHLVWMYYSEPEVGLLQSTQQGRTTEELPSKQEALKVRHEVESWKLIEALWGYIKGGCDAPASGQLRRSSADRHAGGVVEEEESDCDMFVGSQAVLAGFQRRRALSQWLSRQAKALTETELESVSEPCEAVLRLMCANQVAPAVAVAVAAGDSRLATMLVQAGCSSNMDGLTQGAREQLAVWQANDMLGHIQKDRLLIYKLLAGQVEEVRDRLALDWRRLLALLLWYTTPPSASPVQAIHAYQQALHSDSGTPKPVPLYMDQRSSQGMFRPEDRHPLHGVTDLHHELLSLWAAGRSPGGRRVDAENGSSWRQALEQRQVASSLLQAATYSSNPLDASLAWHMMSVLQAVEALPKAGYGEDGGADLAEGGEDYQKVILSCHLNLITQIVIVGGMCEWAVYVALHVPDVLFWPGLRSHLVQELLTAHCPEWRTDASKLKFLTERLGIPKSMLSAAEAVWGQSQGDQRLQCEALLGSGQWSAAHQLLVNIVAPALFLKACMEDLLNLLLAFESCDGVVASEWQSGGALYLNYIAVQKASPAESLDAVSKLISQLQAASDVLMMEGGVQDQNDKRLKLRQRLVLGQMARRLYTCIMTQGDGSTKDRLIAMEGVLSLSCLPPDLRMAGVSATVSAVTPFVLVQAS
ncbi:hypothetical protein CEUSTIGMA_g8703.t1 [Chlamydomonas eustigma]|uniref:Peptidase S59 domain-containing protein n=1 Tax=Chlamydomonas eustigma TaxID=1157962 RepID=A0A250XDZ7_9CHLO|nr:hypothetical protein CEUSTIGMA_g8703.t1 [Chlamydomonas eustigma]|eukprot:GAX81271.1 hypothetical protein CEUSTIGMA_g8703.t1 [Chlamydomonas eustigma]